MGLTASHERISFNALNMAIGYRAFFITGRVGFPKHAGHENLVNWNRDFGCRIGFGGWDGRQPVHRRWRNCKPLVATSHPYNNERD